MQTKLATTARTATGHAPLQQAERGVLALIVRNGKILMQKRSEHIADPGMWVLPGMRALPGQKQADCIAASCSGEFGISVEPLRKIGMITLKDYRCPVWHVQWKKGELLIANNDIAAVGWFSLSELETLKPVRHQEAFRSFLHEHVSHETLELAVQADEAEAAEDDKKEEQRRLAELIIRAQQDDQEAFAEIYDTFATQIFRYIAFRVPREAAEDLVSDVFVKAWEKLHTYQLRKGIPFSSWLFRIARNTVIDSYRTFRETAELDELKKDENRWNDPQLMITQKLQSSLLRKAMMKLSRRYREVLTLSFLADLNTMEVARALHIREGSVRIIKHRALRKLQKWLPESMKEELPS